MLGSPISFPERSAIAAGPLSSLATSLASDLDRLLPDESVFVPREKARMSTAGGRCPRDGAPLEFDPRQPRRHRCPDCGNAFDSEEHYRWWIMGYQLWLAERAVHAAALWRLGRNDRHRRLAESILLQYADRYQHYPNEDNVLGPTRVFFSTYLESIWVLQLAVAVWLLEDGSSTPAGEVVRERVFTPSAELIASFNEGLSNRQVWNSAALAALGVHLRRSALVESAMFGPGGMNDLLPNGLLADGTWYEGENYHLFAHRGLWYLVMLARHVGAPAPPDLSARFDDGFAAPLRTALPDFTFPSRRDSQYRASLRQWRVAESLELGLAVHGTSPELEAGLAEMYAVVPEGDSARWRSTAEAERNVPAVRLTRADLGWKSLLFALPELPPATGFSPLTVLMEGQGLGVIRRDTGRVYVALDYGHSGGGHGHPDRLNLWLVNGARRVFEDVGTGSYVEHALHWYRSTLAHNAPLIDGRSQHRVDGVLRAWDDRGSWTWIEAAAALADDVDVRRRVVVGPEWLIDEVEWQAGRDVTFDLPMHVDADLDGAAWHPAALAGGSGLEDGFEFLDDAETGRVPDDSVRVIAAGVDGGVTASLPLEWWRVRGPGPPGQPRRRFLLARARGSAGRISSAWSWSGPIDIANTGPDALAVTVAGTRTLHRRAGESWAIHFSDGSSVTLDGRRNVAAAAGAPRKPAGQVPVVVPIVRLPGTTPGDLRDGSLGVAFELGRAQYRRTERTWEEAGRPTALVLIASNRADVLVEVTVFDRAPEFAPPRAGNVLDNEHPDTNSDGVQLHLAARGEGERELVASCLMVPQPGSPHVRISARDDANRIPLGASWRQAADGWQLLARIPRSSLGPPDAPFALDVVVNGMPAGRERRLGQLVLGERGGEWAYLRGDRQDRRHFLPMVVQHE
ncbi:MAG TPA: heparinase II/III family protein [Gemmatimonadaceae bacterium]